MKQFVCIMMLAISITGNAFAQDGVAGTNSEKTFEISPSNFERRFFIDLGKGNKLRIELSNLDDLKLFINMDSIIQEFLKDIAPLKDSLSDELSSKRIDVISDSMGRKKMRIQQFQPKGSHFLVNHGEVAALKLEQDTLNFTGKVYYTAKYGFRKPFTELRYYRFSFFLNRLTELGLYADGRLNEKLRTLQRNVNSTWAKDREGRMHLKEDYSISSKQPKGYFSGPGPYFGFNLNVAVQNYKSYFLPSFSLGGLLIVANPFFKREIGLFWEPQFLFVRDNTNKLKTYRNDFITLTLGQGPIKDNDPRKPSYLITILSFGYLIGPQGDYFDKGTMRIGGGRLQLLDKKIMIEPALFFHDFFKGVTPGLKWTQAF